MEEINIKDLLAYFKSKLVYMLIIILLAVGLGIFYKALVEEPIYKSSTSLILTGFSSTSEDESTINNNDLTINQKLLTTYQQITKSRKVLSKVIDELNLDYEVEELAKNISVTGVTDTEIIQITVSDKNAKRAYKIVKKIADVFSDEVRDIYNVSNVSVLDSAEIAKEPSNMSLTKSICLYVAVGTIASVLVVFVAYYFDTTVKTVEQIESKLDVPVLGSIPDYNQKKKKKRVRK